MSWTLIDKGKLLTVVEADMDVSVTGVKNMRAVKMMMENIIEDIEDSPEIKAIPVRWIVNHPRFPKRGDIHDAIIEMIEDWEKERESYVDPWY